MDKTLVCWFAAKVLTKEAAWLALILSVRLERDEDVNSLLCEHCM